MDNASNPASGKSTSGSGRQAIFTPPAPDPKAAPAAPTAAAAASAPASPAAAPAEATASTVPATPAESITSASAASAGPTPAPSATPQPTQPGPIISSTPEMRGTPVRDDDADTGDIILAQDRPKSTFNKTPFIIGLAALAVFVVIAFIVVAVVASGNKKSDDKSGIVTSAAMQSLNKYANYLLYQEDSTKALEGDYDRWRTYALDDQLDGEEKNDNYWQESLQLLNVLQTKYNETVLAEAADAQDEVYDLATGLANALAADYDALQMLQAYSKVGEIVDDLVVTNYLAGGVDGVKNYVRNVYAPLNNSESTAAKAYFNQILQQYELTAQSFNLYRSYNCIVNRAFDESCMDAAYERSAEIQDIEDKIGDLWTKNNAYIENIVSRLESDCWVFSSELTELANAKKGDK